MTPGNLLDDIPIKQPGKFEGETEAALYIYNNALEQDAEDEFHHESLGWWVLYIRRGLEDNLLRYPAYILHERDDGFVELESFENEEDAVSLFNELRKERDSSADEGCG